MTKVKSADVTYLSLEGGGGKGVAYLGAIRALESRNVLPVAKGQVKGMAGSSAGAITAVLLSMGADARKLEEILGKAEDFTNFFSFSPTGSYRSVTDNVPGSWALTPANPSWLENFAHTTSPAQVAPLVDLVSSVLIKYLAGYLLDGRSYRPVLEAVTAHADTYVTNLLFDRGLFTGMGVREFFAKHINALLGDKLKAKGLEGKGATVGFEDFVALTGVDLCLTGTNLTTRRPAFFSARYTPKFPVAEAAAISMNFPGVFKPIVIDSPADLAGFWIDGGLLNNLPIHAFDTLPAFWQKPQGATAGTGTGTGTGAGTGTGTGMPPTGPTPPSPPTPPASPPPPSPAPPEEPSLLQPGMLAIRLTDGDEPTGPPAVTDLKKAAQATLDRAQLEPWLVLKDLVTDFIAAWQYPAEEGQLRTRQERDQSIELYCQKLETLNFTPAKAVADPPTQAAEKKVLAYFDAADRGE